MEDMRNARAMLLRQWADLVFKAAVGGAIIPGKQLQIGSIETVAGPRAGALEIQAFLDSGKFMTAMAKNDFALHRQFVPWAFVGQPSVYMTGRYVRLEAGWSDAMSEKDIPLSSIGMHPKDGGRWIAGKNETGATVTLGLSDKVPHWLFAGSTGSGKTFAIRSAVAQLDRDIKNRFILIDGKYGEGMGPFARMRGMVGPLAVDHDSARAALSYAIIEMRKRYESGYSPEQRGRLVVVIDEIQEMTNDPTIADMVRRLVAQGRGAGVHVIVGTQHPTSAAFKDPTIRVNLVGRVAMRTTDYKSSEAAVGCSTPRADYLLGSGDAYAVVPNAVQRAQLAYISEADLRRTILVGDSEMAAWPDEDAEAAGSLPDVQQQFNPDEIAISVVNAMYNGGRPALVKHLENSGIMKPGSGRAERLLVFGREVYEKLISDGYELSSVGDTAEFNEEMSIESIFSEEQLLSRREVAIGVVNAMYGGGKPALINRMYNAGLTPNASYVERILGIGRDIYSNITDLGYSLRGVAAESMGD